MLGSSARAASLCAKSIAAQMRTLSGSRARCAHDLSPRRSVHELRVTVLAELLRDVEDACQCPSSAWSSVPTDAKTASETGARADRASFASPSSIVAGTSMGAFYSSRRAGKSRLDASLVAIDVALEVSLLDPESHAKLKLSLEASLRWERRLVVCARARAVVLRLVRDPVDVVLSTFDCHARPPAPEAWRGDLFADE